MFNTSPLIPWAHTPILSGSQAWVGNWIRIPKLPHSYKFTASHNVWVVFLRLLVPSCCCFEPWRSHHIHTLGLMLRYDLWQGSASQLRETSTKSSTIYGCKPSPIFVNTKIISFSYICCVMFELMYFNAMLIHSIEILNYATWMLWILCLF